MSENSSDIRARLQRIVEGDRVVLFMKGTRRAPQCGFSASVVDLLDGWIDAYTTVDVLAEPELREGVKAFSDWPTIPQLYVGGEFVGGADIVRELEEGGELGGTLGAGPPEPPEITITDEAAAQFKAALASEDIDEHDVLRLIIDQQFRNDLSVGPRRPGDLEVETKGLRLVLDRRSARRARGLSIDFIEGPEGAGFKIDNPNAPPEVRELSVRELARRLEQAEAAGEQLRLYDVRTQEERAIAKIDAAALLDAEIAKQIEELPRDTPLYFHCHHGRRSFAAGEHFIGLGFGEVYNVSGGIDAWSQEVDPEVPRY